MAIICRELADMRCCLKLELSQGSIGIETKVLHPRPAESVTGRSASIIHSAVFVCALLTGLAVFTSARSANARSSHALQRQSSNSTAQQCHEAAAWMEAARQLQAQNEQSSLSAALEKYNQALLCWQSLKAHRESAETFRGLGDIYFATGNYEAARQSYRNSMSESSRISDGLGKAQALVGLGLVYVYLDESDQSLNSSAEALSLADKLGDQELRAKVLSNYALGYLARRKLGDLAQASRNIDEALKIAEKLNDPNTIARALLFSGFIKTSFGQLGEALALYQRAVSLWQAQNKLEWQSRALSAMGGVYVATGEPQKALNYIEQALAMQQQLGNRKPRRLRSTIWVTLISSSAKHSML